MKKLLLIVVLLVTAFVAVGLFLPTRVRVERSITVDRPAVTVFTLLNSYRSFNQWSPWAQQDPQADWEVSGPASGVGARLSWEGDPALVGSGWQEIVENIPNRRVAMHLDFGPQGEADTWFTIRGEGPRSHVTWGFETDVTRDAGPVGNLLNRYFGLFFDRWVGADYEAGLTAFERLAESLPPHDFAGADIRVLDVKSVPILFVAERGDPPPEAVADMYAEVMAFVNAYGISVEGEPMAITRGWRSEDFRLLAAIPVGEVAAEPTGRVRLGRSPGGRAARIVHTGPYDATADSYEQVIAYLAAHGYEDSGVSWEHYVTNPAEVPPEELVTHIYVQLEGETGE